MANPVSRKDVEYQYFTRKLTAGGITVGQNTSLNEMKKVWWSHVVGGNQNQTTFSDLEKRWLGTFTGVTGEFLYDRWRQALVSLNTGQPMPHALEEVKNLFYTFAP